MDPGWRASLHAGPGDPHDRPSDDQMQPPAFLAASNNTTDAVAGSSSHAAAVPALTNGVQREDSFSRAASSSRSTTRRKLGRLGIPLPSDSSSASDSQSVHGGSDVESLAANPPGSPLCKSLSPPLHQLHLNPLDHAVAGRHDEPSSLAASTSSVEAGASLPSMMLPHHAPVSMAGHSFSHIEHSGMRSVPGDQVRVRHARDQAERASSAPPNETPGAHPRMGALSDLGRRTPRGVDSSDAEAAKATSSSASASSLMDEDDPAAAVANRGAASFAINPGPAPRISSELAAPDTQDHERPSGLSEESFRDIVDSLTLQNQQLRGRLRRYEAPRVPHDLKREALFEIRFGPGLPRSRRQEIEAYLTHYVQYITTGTVAAVAGPTGGTSSPANQGHSSGANATESTSSLSGEFRSLRDSERESLERRALGIVDGARAQGPAATASGDTEHSRSSRDAAAARESASDAVEGASGSSKDASARSGSNSGSGSNNNAAQKRREVERTALGQPPPLLPRLPPMQQTEQDRLAGASHFGIEPVSLSGTGNGMKLANTISKRRKSSTVSKKRAAVEAAAAARVMQDPGERDWSASPDREAGPGSDDLAKLVVDLVERLFSDSLPIVTEDGSPAPPDVAFNRNSLSSEPFPLPHRSRTNTQYMQALLTNEDTVKSNGWIYLNLVLTMAGMHRLNVSINFVRHALRMRSEHVEVSPDGTMIRWLGPAQHRWMRQPQSLTDAIDKDAARNNESHKHKEDVQRVEVQSRKRKALDSSPEPSEGVSNVLQSTTDGNKNSTTEATSMLENSNTNTNSNSKLASTSGTGSGHRQTLATSSRSTRSQDEDTSSKRRSSLAGSNEGRSIAASSQNALSRNRHLLSVARGAAPGSVVGVSAPSQTQATTYVPRFGHIGTGSDSDDEESESSDSGAASGPANAANSQSASRAAKRRRITGGVVYFATDKFCSDLAGDASIRQALEEEARNASRASPSASSSGAGASGSNSGQDETMSQSMPSTRHFASSEAPSMMESSSEHSSSQASGRETSVVWPRLDLAPLTRISEEAEMAIDDESVPPPKVITDLALSGMTKCVPSDNFTLYAKTLHPLPTLSAQPGAHLRDFANFRELFANASFYNSGDRLPSQHKMFTLRLVNGIPVARCRPPRVRMVRSDGDDSSPSPSASPPASPQPENRQRPPTPVIDYAMSLALPLNAWAPQNRPITSDEESATDNHDAPIDIDI